MLALAGVVRQAGSVDDGNTVTDFLPAERERGITIQSAAVSFEWSTGSTDSGNDGSVQIQLIDTPGHVDFSVEVNRSVAVLDGAVLVVDAVAGVQAQTETVWRAMTTPGSSGSIRKDTGDDSDDVDPTHAHEPLPCLAMVNKMDKEGSDFANAIESLRAKLPGANPIAAQMPLFWNAPTRGNAPTLTESSMLNPAIGSLPADDLMAGNFVGMVDLVHMRAVVYPDGPTTSVEDCIPEVVPLLDPVTEEPLFSDCSVTNDALVSRKELVASLADVDEQMEELYLMEEDPTIGQLRAALRRATLARKALPVMSGAALRGRGVEPLLDCIAELLPSPLDRLPPVLSEIDNAGPRKKKKSKKNKKESSSASASSLPNQKQPTITPGHPLHPSLLAIAFKVVHMKGRGGSGDGRVVFCRVYSGMIKDGDILKVVTPPSIGETPEPPRKERVGGMLELYGGHFDNLEDGMCPSGGVCALIGLKSVVTGDTILTQKNSSTVCLAGVASPKPVLTVRLEAETSDEQTKLSEALQLYAIEDPSLYIEETEAATLLSGLGELHIEVTLDRLRREFGLNVTSGQPAVTYREGLLESVETDGLVEYDRTIGNTRLQGAVHILLEPISADEGTDGDGNGAVCVPSDPVVRIGSSARAFFEVDEDTDEEDLVIKNELIRSLVQGCEGALERGPLSNCGMANLSCTIVAVQAEGGLPYLKESPGALRAAAAHAVSNALAQANTKGHCTVLEPTMGVEVVFPTDMVGSVLSDLHGRRAILGEVVSSEGDSGSHTKGFIYGDVPLVEILGYANSLRSLTGGEGAFSAEYRGHSPCDVSSMQR